MEQDAVNMEQDAVNMLYTLQLLSFVSYKKFGQHERSRSK